MSTLWESLNYKLPINYKNKNKHTQTDVNSKKGKVVYIDPLLREEHTTNQEPQVPDKQDVKAKQPVRSSTYYQQSIFQLKPSRFPPKEKEFLKNINHQATKLEDIKEEEQDNLRARKEKIMYIKNATDNILSYVYPINII